MNFFIEQKFSMYLSTLKKNKEIFQNLDPNIDIKVVLMISFIFLRLSRYDAYSVRKLNHISISMQKKKINSKCLVKMVSILYIPDSMFFFITI